LRIEPDLNRESSLRYSLFFSLWLSAIVGAAPVRAQPEPSPRLRERTYNLAGNATLLLTVPSEWKEETRNVATAFPTIVFTPPTGSSFQLLIKPIPNLVEPSSADPDKLRTVVKETAYKLVGTAGERELKLVELKGKAVFGYRYTLTDRARKAGAFPFITAGGVQTGDFLVQFTLLHRDFETSQSVPLEVLQSLEIKSAQPIAEKTETRLLVKSKKR
jgi:hypothetical protein